MDALILTPSELDAAWFLVKVCGVFAVMALGAAVLER